VNQIPYPLDFIHKYNLHKALGLLIADDDLPSIARIYGVGLEELRAVDTRFRRNVANLAARLAEQNPIAKAATPITILALGDSITSDRESYVKILNHYWRDHPNRVMIDCGVSGDTGCHVINRFYATASAQPSDWVVIFLGTNDCRQADDGSGISNLSVEESERDLRYVTARFLEQGRKLVYVTLPPVDNTRLKAFFAGRNWVYDPRRLDAANACIRALATETGSGIADLARAIADSGRDYLEPDGLHLNGEGQLLLSGLLVEALP
jgi:lysophospholipase L1-like esterase